MANFGTSGPLEDIYIINNTIYGKGHRGIYINNLDVRNIYIRNNICSQNNISQIDIKSALIDSVVLEYNLIEGVSIDGGDFPVLGCPDFVNASIGNFHLSTTSWAIDNGTSADAPDIDFDGSIRPCGAGYDIRAYEYPSTTSIIDSPKKTDILYFPNPTTNTIIIEGEDIESIDFLNTEGQVVIQLNRQQEKCKININSLSTGLYIVKIGTNKGSVIKKIVLE